MSGSEEDKRLWVARVLGVDLGGPAAAGTAPPAVSPKEVARRCLQLWLDAKEQADLGLSRLQQDLRGTNDPIFLRIADRGLAAVSGRVQVGLRVGLEEFARAPEKTGPAAAALARRVAEFRRFIESDPAVMLCDENPFDTDVGLRATLGQALAQIDRELKLVGA